MDIILWTCLRARQGGALHTPGETVRCNGRLADQSVVAGMGSDPKPHEAVSRLDRESTMTTADSDGPEAANLLEMQRRVPWVVLEANESFVRELLDSLGQVSVAHPEVRGRMVIQRSVVRPDE